MTDWLDLVGAAYDVDEPSHDRWLGRLIDLTKSKIPQALETSGAFFHYPRGGVLQVLPHTAAPRVFLEGTALIEPAVVCKLHRGLPFSMLSAAVGKSAVKDLFAASGVPWADLAGMVCRDPGPWGINIIAAVPKMKSISASTVASWTRVAAHVHAGLRLRIARHGAPHLPPAAGLLTLHSTTDAVLTLDGRVEHAEGRAIAARVALREAAVALTRARTQTRKHDSEQALREWQSLVQGQWSLVDRFESDGRRYLIAQRNSPDVAKRKALSVNETQVASFRAMGHSMKLIGYELGLPVSSVSKLLTDAAAKLGLTSPDEFAHLAEVDPPAALPVASNPAPVGTRGRTDGG